MTQAKFFQTGFIFFYIPVYQHLNKVIVAFLHYMPEIQLINNQVKSFLDVGYLKKCLPLKTFYLYFFLKENKFNPKF